MQMKNTPFQDFGDTLNTVLKENTIAMNVYVYANLPDKN